MPRVASTPVQAQAKMETDGGQANGASGLKNSAEWLTKIKDGAIHKVPKDVQKRRRNYRLGRLLNPKAPMVVLQELTKQGEVTFEKYISDPMSHLIKCSAKYDGQTFEGVGPTKNIAKNICSEAILQYIAFKACERDQAGTGISSKEGPHREEETPWTALASVALFKMFNDWQAQGAVIPAELMKCVPRPAPANPAMAEDVKMEDAKKTVKPAKPRAEKTLPADAASRHPVQMLHEMLGTMNYETVTDGYPLKEVVYHMSVLVNDQKYTGSAKNKKDAKKQCAMEVMRNVYCVEYPESQAIKSET
jgi:hypothetical protein